MAKKLISDEERFSRFVMPIPHAGCMVWTGAVCGGYGVFSVGSRTDGSKRRVYAHRWAWENTNPAIPDGLYLDHKCRVRSCVNPDHLRVVTARVNILCGTAPPAINAAKTHCKNGHEFTEENTMTGQNRRSCRQCTRKLWRAYYYRTPKIRFRRVKK